MAETFSNKLLKAYQLDAAALPSSYLDFLNKVDAYSGMYGHGFYGYTEEAPLKMNFKDTWVLRPAMVFDDNDLSREDYPTLLPLARMPHDADFFVTDIGKKDCPVMLWDHETNAFNEISPTLEDFLGSLNKSIKKAKKPNLAPLKKKLLKALPQAEALMEAEKYTEAIALLTEALGEQRPVRYSGSGSKDDIEPYTLLGNAFQFLGLCKLWSGQEKKEVLACFLDAYGSGGSGGDEAYICVVGTYCLLLKDPGKALAFEKESEAVGYFDYFIPPKRVKEWLHTIFGVDAPYAAAAEAVLQVPDAGKAGKAFAKWFKLAAKGK